MCSLLTGRMPVDPSQAVVAKTNTFGTGRATQVCMCFEAKILHFGMPVIKKQADA